MLEDLGRWGVEGHLDGVEDDGLGADVADGGREAVTVVVGGDQERRGNRVASELRQCLVIEGTSSLVASCVDLYLVEGQHGNHRATWRHRREVVTDESAMMHP